MNAKEVYECPQCETVHDDAFEAIHCCRLSPHYKCTSCNEVYSFEDTAEQCCTQNDDDSTKYPKTIEMFP